MLWVFPGLYGALIPALPSASFKRYVQRYGSAPAVQPDPDAPAPSMVLYGAILVSTDGEHFQVSLLRNLRILRKAFSHKGWRLRRACENLRKRSPMHQWSLAATPKIRNVPQTFRTLNRP